MIVLNPAVRGVTAWKYAASSFSPTPSGASVFGLVHSSARMASVPPASRQAVTVSTSFVWTDIATAVFFRRRRRPESTKNPRPPAMMSVVMTRLMVRSPR